MKKQNKKAPKLDVYLTVSEAAQMLGVSGSTLRNWDQSGKLKAARHPLNGYRLYLRDELEKILIEAEATNG